MKIIGYTDSSYARDSKNKKLIIKYYFFLDKRIIAWSNK